MICILFFFNDTATTEIYTLSLHDALPISMPLPSAEPRPKQALGGPTAWPRLGGPSRSTHTPFRKRSLGPKDRKSTRLNSSHVNISYAVFCFKKKIPIHHNYDIS